MYCVYSHVAQMDVLGENTSVDCLQIAPNDCPVTTKDSPVSGDQYPEAQQKEVLLPTTPSK